jgi:hypothetical protein
MKALSSFVISMLFLFNGLWITGINGAHAASCPANRAYAGIKIWHYLESTQGGPYYTQTTEYEGTVGIQFQYASQGFHIIPAGNVTISKTIDAKLVSPFWNCTYETGQAKVEVYVSERSSICNDGILNMHIIEIAEEASVDYHCVDGDGNVYGPFTQVYPATRLTHDVMIEYAHETMVVHPFTEGTGSYSWTLLFRKTPVPTIEGGRTAVPILPLLLNDE